MKKLLTTLLFLLLVPLLHARVLVYTTRTFDIVKNGTPISLVGTAVNYHRISWSYTDAVSGCTVKLSSSADNSTYADLISAQTCTSAGMATPVTGSHNWVRIDVTALSGGGTLSVTYEGFGSDPSAAIGLGGPAGGNLDMANFTVQNIGNAGTDFTSTGGLNLAAPLTVTQGVLTAFSTASFINHTATWNNAAVTFTGFLSNITDTASSVNSLLFDYQVNGASKVWAKKDGSFQAATVSATSDLIAGAARFIFFSGRSLLSSPANGILTISNNALTDLTRVNLGGDTTAFPTISKSAAVASQTQGVIIQRADGTPQVFANLGAATNGSMIYCSDCAIAATCVGAGTGAIAKRLNGIWVCN